MRVNLKNDYNMYKEAKIGVSWTSLFFGFLTPLIRKDFTWAAIMLVANSLTGTLARWVFMFIYNKYYIKGLLEQGYYPANEYSQDMLLRNGFMFDKIDFKQKKEETN